MLLPHRALIATLLLTPALAFAQKTQPRTPVLVELFTSEGCSSCPPADALLKDLEHTQPVPAADIIVLGEHVDYWDSLGWRDRFSSPRNTQRQQAYASRMQLDSSYTPQMVVDGTAQFVGNDRSRALTAIDRASHSPKLVLTLAPATVSGRTLASSVTLDPSTHLLPNADLFAALVEPSASTDVPRGENSGRRLQHVAVARSLERIGSLKDLVHASVPFTLTAPADTNPARLRLVVFAQAPGLGAIVAAAITPATSGSATSTATALALHP